MDPDAPIFKVMIFKFELPQTKKIAFHKFIRTSDTASVDALTKASIARDDMLEHLKKQDPSQALITAIENYIPHLFGLIVSVDGQPHIRLNDPLSFSWTSSLTNHRKSFFTDYTFRYETVMTLMTYGYALCNRAWSINSTTTETTFEESSKQTAHFLRLAAGVFDYVHTVELPRWLNMPADRPLEAIASITAALSLMCLAGAEEIAVKKAVLKKTSKQTTSKLSADVWKKYENAIYQLNAMPGDSKKNVNPTWRAFLGGCEALQKANTLKFAGAIAEEGKKIGLACSFLELATKCLKDCIAPNDKSTLGPWKEMIDQQRADVEHFHRLYTKENNMIAFEKLVDEHQLEFPEPKALMTSQQYNAPFPAFTQIK
jgi:hypothetical protein